MLQREGRGHAWISESDSSVDSQLREGRMTILVGKGLL